MSARALDGARLRWLDVVFVAVAVTAVRLVFVWAIPLAAGGPDPNCAPDELEHFLVVRELARGRVPTWPELPSIYAAFPPVPYLPHAALLAAGAPWASCDALYRAAPVWPELLGFPFARLGGVAAGILTGIALSRATARSLDSRRAGVVAGLVVALHPQLAFVNAYVNADSFTIAAGAVLVAAVEAWSRRRGDRSVAWVAAAAALVVGGKPSGYFLLVSTGAWLALAWRRGAIRTRAAVLSLATFSSLTLPLLVWNALRNGGDVLGIVAFHRWLEQWGRADARALPDAATLFATTLVESAFARFGNMTVALPAAVYWVAYCLLCAGLACAGARVLIGRSRRARELALWIAASVSINLALVVYDTWFVEFQAQGRWMLLSVLLLTIVAVLAPTGAPTPVSSVLGSTWSCAYLAFLSVALAASLVAVVRSPCAP